MNPTKKIKIGKFHFIPTWIFPEDVSKFLIMKMARFGKSTWNDKKQCWESAKWTHVFCGRSQIGDLRIDIDPDVKPDVVADCLDLPIFLGENSQENIIADFPWSIGYPDRRKFVYALRDICEVGGVLLFNCPWSPEAKGLELIPPIYKVAQAYNSYRDLVDWWIFRKTKA